MRALLVALLVLAPTALAAPHLDAVLPRPAGGSAGEFVRLANPEPTPAALEGWAIASGTRSLALHGELPAHGTFTMARDAAAYQRETGALADAQVDLPPLADGGGALTLRGAGEETVVWPALPSAMVWQRGADGTWGTRHVGWSAWPVLATPAEVLPFTRHDALPTALAALAAARREVRVAVYELTNPDLAAALQAAAARGVQVHVLVEGAPVGGMPASEVARLDGLAAAGVDVRTMGGTGQDRYGALHAKFAVLDGSLVMLGSENWGGTGFAADGRGNRGWGVLVRDAGVARYFARVWDEDADPVRGDVRPWPGRTPEQLAAPASTALPGFATAEVTVLLAPDTAAAFLLALPARAARTLDVEHLQLPPSWSTGPNPLVEAVQAAAARGVRVRILLDGQDADNAATAAELTREAARQGWALEVRLAPFRVHNKGLLLDGARAVVGSVNGGEASMLRNREAALVVQGDVVATYAQAFEEDWADAGPARPEGLSPWLAGPPLLTLAALAVARSRRRG